jgi:Fic family protein
MKLEDFSLPQQSYLTKTASGSLAFVPPDLAPKFEYGEIALQLGATYSAIGELKGATRRLQNPYMLMMPLIRKEALTSSAIEGTITTLSNMLLEEVSPRLAGDENAREASNYIAALRQAEETLIKLPISHRVIKQAHQTLLSGLSATRGSSKTPGAYKTSQNAIGSIGDDELSARYVPPPPLETTRCMDQLEQFINRQDRRAGEELIDIALAHYQFEAIHPFNDSNGRIGRMLVSLMARQLLFDEKPLLHISAKLEDQKEEYIKRLFAVSAAGDWIGWINFFLKVVQESCVSAISTVDKIINLQNKLRANAVQNSNNHRLPAIIDFLFNTPWISTSSAERLTGVTFPTAKSDLDELVTLNILTKIENIRPVTYVAHDIRNLSNRGA